MNKAAIALGYILVVLGAVSMIAPFLWMAAVSFMTDSQIFSFPPGFIPHPFTFANYANIFEKLPVTRFFLNSLFVALITTFFQVLFSAMAGFAFARGSFRHKDLLFFMFLVTMMIPPQVNIIPLFFLMRELHLIDTYQALILPGVFGGFGVFLMRQWFKSMSSEIEDAAKIDGCNMLQTFFKIALPLSLSALVTLALFTLITTLPVALSAFKSSFRETVLWGDLTACSIVLSLPVTAVFLLGKKYFISDMLSGGIKE